MAASSMSRPTPLPDAWIERLFEILLSLYGGRFNEMWGICNPEKMRVVWAEWLGGYSGTEIARGIAACRVRDWPPTLPEFLKLCRPPIDPEEAYQEAIAELTQRRLGKDRWSHPAIFWAAASIGSHDLMSSHWGAMKNRWTNRLRAELAKNAWPEIPPHREALPSPGRTSISTEEASKRLAEMRQILAGYVTAEIQGSHRHA